MLNVPKLKFEKSCNYLNDQLNTQTNNKQLILDIISNIGLVLNSDVEKQEQYTTILNTANKFLQIISENITLIEQLNLEMTNINKELSSVLTEQTKTTKAKEFYIAAFSNIKNNVETFSAKFQKTADKLNNDNTEFNNFINENNFKYNFVSIDDSTNTYTFTGFSINDTEEADLTQDTPSTLENPENISENLEEQSETLNDDELLEAALLDSIESDEIFAELLENTEELSIDISNQSDEIVIPEQLTSSTVAIETTPEENELFEILNYLNKIDTPTSNTSQKVYEFKDIYNVFDDIYEEATTKSKIDTITNEFKDLLINATGSGAPTFESINSAITLLQSYLSPVAATNTTTEEAQNQKTFLETNEDETSMINDSVEIYNNYLIESISNDIYFGNLEIIYEFEVDEELEYVVPIGSKEAEPISIVDVIESVEIVPTDENIKTNETNETNEANEANEANETNETVESIEIENLLDSDIDKKILELLDVESNDVTIIEDSPIQTENVENINLDDSEEIIELIDSLPDEPNHVDVNLFDEELSAYNIDLSEEIDLFSNILDDEPNLLEEQIENIENANPETIETIEPQVFENEDNNPIKPEENDESIDIDLADEVSEQTEIQHIEFPKNSNSIKSAKQMSKTEFEEKLLKIQSGTKDNKTLIISERLKKIYLPYQISELENYIESYPSSYSSLQDVVEQEFILPFNYFKKNPSKARFTESYNLLKNREGKNFMKSVSYAFRLLNKNNLNPAVIASCKTQHELDSYLYYLDSNNLNNFKFFDIIYEVNPL